MILFLDDTILWVATYSADPNFVQTEPSTLSYPVESRQAKGLFAKIPLGQETVGSMGIPVVEIRVVNRWP